MSMTVATASGDDEALPKPIQKAIYDMKLLMETYRLQRGGTGLLAGGFLLQLGGFILA